MVREGTRGTKNVHFTQAFLDSEMIFDSFLDLKLENKDKENEDLGIV